MKSLHQRLTTLDQQGRQYLLDYITMRNGFVYRNAHVLSHNEESIFINQEGKNETFINMEDISTAQIINL
ncbi:hypothetical protein [Rhizobium sp. CECT 9324]|uniref:hypothetical protein n=1 Tax=Rhizobium sp. CECT 9324 TaxID=2845820 RepID=UPI001E5F0EC4|nr:hypothetical protein [Rhizobium sp. CECT 9324]CAH0342314.1 hypothetical protein RHI9324_04037 [Rhizobium sp. CECT 9324]CAH0343756.1 hypothetical protein RHI9324_05494 [Rhizobium sp. CECT 9324]